MKMKATVLATLAALVLAGCITEEERLARAAAEKARQEQIAREAKEREERLAREQAERVRREKLTEIESQNDFGKLTQTIMTESDSEVKASAKRRMITLINSSDAAKLQLLVERCRISDSEIKSAIDMRMGGLALSAINNTADKKWLHSIYTKSEYTDLREERKREKVFKGNRGEATPVRKQQGKPSKQEIVESIKRLVRDGESTYNGKKIDPDNLDQDYVDFMVALYEAGVPIGLDIEDRRGTEAATPTMSSATDMDYEDATAIAKYMREHDHPEVVKAAFEKLVAMTDDISWIKSVAANDSREEIKALANAKLLEHTKAQIQASDDVAWLTEMATNDSREEIKALANAKLLEHTKAQIQVSKDIGWLTEMATNDSREEIKALAYEKIKELKGGAVKTRSERIDWLVAETLKSVRDSYDNQRPYKCAYPRDNGQDVDWLSVWVEPRREISEEDKLAGEAILEEFGTTYLPQAYAAYEKARDTAKEIQQVYNEEFPRPWMISSASPKWKTFNKVLEKFVKARTEYFWRHDELCELWLQWKFGVLSAEKLAEMDSDAVVVFMLEENFALNAFSGSSLQAMSKTLATFSQQYAPESYAIHLQLVKDWKDLVATISEAERCCRKMDMSRWSRTIIGAIFKRDQIAKLNDALIHDLESLRVEHRTMEKTADGVALSDHRLAMEAKPYIESLDQIQMINDSWKPVMVSIPGKYYRMQTTEVTQLQWMCVMGNNPSCFKGLNRPVENVSLDDCKEFLKRLNLISKTEYGKAVYAYRLPTKEEWEYAGRAGATKWGYYCKLADGTEVDNDTLGNVAWFWKNSNRNTHPVGQKVPNAYGLYDMYGNVWEWTSSSYDNTHYYCCGGGCDELCSLSSEGHVSSPSTRANELGFRLCADGLAD